LITKRLIEQLDIQGNVRTNLNLRIVHQLADQDKEKLQGWITECLYLVPSQVQALGARLAQLSKEQEHLKLDLERAPSDEILAPLHEEIIRLKAELATVQARQANVSEQIGSIQYQRTEAARKMTRLADELEDAQATEVKLTLAERSRVVLRVYEDALTRTRLSELEQALVAAFNRICQKEHLLTAVTIDPDSFAVRLQNADGGSISVAEFSAGERQLFALAILQSLRQVSGRELPLCIDTPLARLDQVHRSRFLTDYVPHASRQVLLFATNAELDSSLLRLIRPYTARVYNLAYNPEVGATEVTTERLVDCGVGDEEEMSHVV
jgi:DNA sulfur modification protein DndD